MSETRKGVTKKGPYQAGFSGKDEKPLTWMIEARNTDYRERAKRALDCLSMRE